MARLSRTGRFARCWPFDRPGGGTQTITVNGNVTANNGETIVQLALRGVGIARLAEFAVGPAIRSGMLVSLLADRHHADRMPISAVYLPTKQAQPKVRAFVDFLVSKFQPRPPWEARPAEDR